MAALEPCLLLARDTADVAHRRAENDPDPLRRVSAEQAGIVHRFLACGQRELRIARELAQLFGRRQAGRVEVLDLGADAHGIVARIESLDEVDPALPRHEPIPGRGDIVPERRDGTKPGDDDATHGETLVEALARARNLPPPLR